MTTASPAATPGTKPFAVLTIALVAILAGFIASLAVRGTGGSETKGPGQASLDKIHWKVPVAFATTLAALGDTPVLLSESLKKASAGSVELTIYEPGKLVPAFSITDAVKDKKIEAGYTWLGYDQGKIPSSPLFSAVPFGMEPWEFASWWYESGGDKLAQEVYGAHGVRPILCGLIGPETAGWFRNEIKSVDDLRGLKIRFAGLGGQVMQSFGASVTVLPGGEIFPALEKGAIDATEFSMPNIDKQLGFDKLVKNNYFPGWHQPFTAFHLVVNTDVWNKLGDGSRAIIEMGCTAATLRNLARGESLQGAVLESFKQKGVQARRIPEPVLRELEKSASTVLEGEASKDLLFKKVYDSQLKFRAEYKPWKSLGYLPRDF